MSTPTLATATADCSWASPELRKRLDAFLRERDARDSSDGSWGWSMTLECDSADVRLAIHEWAEANGLFHWSFPKRQHACCSCCAIREGLQLKCPTCGRWRRLNRSAVKGADGAWRCIDCTTSLDELDIMRRRWVHSNNAVVLGATFRDVSAFITAKKGVSEEDHYAAYIAKRATSRSDRTILQARLAERIIARPAFLAAQKLAREAYDARIAAIAHTA